MKKILLTLLGIAAFAAAQAQIYPLVPIDSVQYVSPALLSAMPAVTVSPTFNGDTVRVRGVVMFNPRLSALSTNFKNTYLAVPGATTGFKGVNVRLATLADSTTTQFFDNVQVGNVVEITGKVAHFPATTNGETQIDLIAVPTSVVSVSTPNAPIAKNIGDFMTTAAGVSTIQYLTGEPYEGMYVEFQNVSIVDVVQTGTAPAVRFRWSVQDAAGNKIGIRDVSVKYRNTAAQPNNISASTATTPNPNAAVYLQQGKSFAYIRGTITKLFITASGSYEYQLVPLTSSDLGPVTASPPVITTITSSNPVPTSTNAVTITANITDLDGTVTGTSLKYAVGLTNPTFTTVPMTLTAGSIYTATIPAQPNNSFVKFYVSATDNQNNVSNFPDTLATNSYYKVLDAGITKISDIQQTPIASGASIYAGKSITSNINIKAKVISTSATNDLGILTLQDGTTPYSGIFALSGANSPAFDTAVRGDSVLITAATIIENFGITQLQDVTATLITATNCNTNSVKPNIDSVLASTRNTTEALEGMLVEFNNVQIVKVNADAPSNFGEFSFYTTATGNGVRADDLSNEIIPTFNIDSLTVGLPLGYIKGIMYFAFGNWKILPRNLKDIQGFYSTYECIPIATTDLNNDVFEIETIYPNPANDNLNIGLILKKANNVRISYIDILGKTITTENRKMERGEYRLQNDISNLSNGVYMVQVQVDGYTKAFRLIKK
jgi:hypothetical protein